MEWRAISVTAGRSTSWTHAHPRGRCGFRSREVVKFIKAIGADAAIKIINDGQPTAECHNVDEKALQEQDLEIALDSRAVKHVCSNDHTEGNKLQAPEASRSGASFIVGDGASVPNQLGKLST